MKILGQKRHILLAEWWKLKQYKKKKVAKLPSEWVILQKNLCPTFYSVSYFVCVTKVAIYQLTKK